MKYFGKLKIGSSYTVSDKTFLKDIMVPVDYTLYKYLEGKKDCFDVFMSPEDSDVLNREPISPVKAYKDKAMNIAIAYSPNWAQYVRIAVYSLFKNNKGPIRVYLLSDEMGYIDLDPVCKLFGKGYSFEFINVEKIFKHYIPSDINIDGRFTKYTLYRLLIPKFILEDRLLYIDADAMVVGDISKLYNLDLENCIIAGVQDTGIGPFLKNIGFQYYDIYINAGVTLMDLKTIRELNLSDEWIEMVNKKFYDCHDQDILNITCKNRVKLIDPIYNVSLSTRSDIPDKDIRIIHYAGPKPWDSGATMKHFLWSNAYDNYRQDNLPMIPKKIHYAWFGGKDKPDMIKRCLESWDKYLKGYEIIEWNEGNFDVNSLAYTKEAYAKKKYAFINDYLRLCTMYNIGGIYLDSDVEVLKSLDKFLINRAFTGHETKDILVTATTGSEPRHPWVGLLLAYYKISKLEIVPNTKIITDISKPYIIRENRGTTYLKDDVVIYPVNTFCPYDHENLKPIPTRESYAIHHFAGTWIGRTKV